MLKEDMWKIFKNTGDIEAYLYYKKSEISEVKDNDLKEYEEKILQVQ